MTLTKEQLNNFYIKMLEEIKQDELILSKLDSFQILFDAYQNFTSQERVLVKDEFIKKIEEKIQEISKNNIGQEETKIIVYENNGKTVKTTIEGVDYEMQLEMLWEEENYIKLSYRNADAEQEISYHQTKENRNLTFKNKKDEAVKEYSILKKEMVEDTKANKTITAKYEDDSNQIECYLDQKINVINHLEDEIVFDEQNAINLSKLEEENLKAIVNRASEGISQRVNEIMQTSIPRQDLLKVLQTIGVTKEEQVVESRDITQTQRNRFNSKFEILQGENLSSENILKIAEAIKDNLVDIEVVSDTELRLKLDQFNRKEEMTAMLNSFIEQNKNKKYNVKIEYNETTGLVQDILLSMVTK